MPVGVAVGVAVVVGVAVLVGVIVAAYCHPRTWEEYYYYRWSRAETLAKRAQYWPLLLATEPAAERLAQYEEMGIEVVSHGACSGCWTEFRHIYYSLGEERAKLKGLTFVLGRVEKLPWSDRPIILGECARAVADRGIYLPGCPPDHDDIERAARERWAS